MSEVKRKRGRPRKTNIVNNTNLPDGTAKEIVSTKKKRNRSDLSNYGQEFIEAGDNTKFITFAMESRRLPKLNFEDIPAVQERINWYFTRCAEQDMKPGVVGLANALGIDRRTLWSWKTGERRAENKELADTIKQAYSFLEEMWEMYMQNGKIAPPNGIFLGKTTSGMSMFRTLLYNHRTHTMTITRTMYETSISKVSQTKYIRTVRSNNPQNTQRRTGIIYTLFCVFIYGNIYMVLYVRYK